MWFNKTLHVNIWAQSTTTPTRIKTIHQTRLIDSWWWSQVFSIYCLLSCDIIWCHRKQNKPMMVDNNFYSRVFILDPLDGKSIQQYPELQLCIMKHFMRRVNSNVLATHKLCMILYKTCFAFSISGTWIKSKNCNFEGFKFNCFEGMCKKSY